MDNNTSSPLPSVLRSPGYYGGKIPDPNEGTKSRIIVIVVIGLLALLAGSFLLFKIINHTVPIANNKADTKNQTASGKGASSVPVSTI
jgi:flagellar basal body-associated protein FliL